MHTYPYTHTSTHVYTHRHTNMHARTYTCIHTHTHTLTHAHSDTHTLTHTQTHPYSLKSLLRQTWGHEFDKQFHADNWLIRRHTLQGFNFLPLPASLVSIPTSPPLPYTEFLIDYRAEGEKEKQNAD